MDWTAPISITLPADVTPFRRLVALLGHYDFRVYRTERGYIDIGAGSLHAVENLIEVPRNFSGLLGRIGRFCEVNTTARILVGGEHNHDAPVNITFSGLPLMGDSIDAMVLKPHTPFEIGNGVVISTDATILGGARIGDGAVIAAGAVVTRPVDRLGVYAGVPARKLRERPPFAPWWDFEPAHLLANRANLQDMARDPSAAYERRPDRPRFVLRATHGELNLMGFLEDDTVAPLERAPRAVLEYVTQAVQAERPYWLADCWAGLGNAKS